MRLPPTDRRFHVHVGVVLLVVRFALWFVPFRRLDRLLAPIRRRGRSPRPRSVQEIDRAVIAMSRVVPRSTCLVRAVAAQLIMERNGHPTELRFGVAQTGGDSLAAHAWLESDGTVVSGHSFPDRYVPLSAPPRRL
jgi:hypothetical protein